MLSINIKNIKKQQRGYLQVLCHLVAIIGVLLISTSCSKRFSDLPAFTAFPFKDYENESVGRFKSSYLVDQFDKFYRGTSPGPIGVTTFVNIDDLYTTSTFGRMYAEQVMSELSMHGFDVVELRHADALQFLASSGEFALSRDVGFVRRERELGAVVVGTYVVSPVRVYVNARLIDPSTSKVLTAGSVEMSKTEEIAKMLRGGTVSATLERIPVKHIGFSTFPLNIMPNSNNRVLEVEEDASAPSVLPQLPSISSGHNSAPGHGNYGHGNLGAKPAH
jgi:TolB-like protein